MTARILRFVALGALLLCTGAAALLLGGRPVEPAAPEALLAARARTLRARLELERGDRPWLLLEPARGRLTLYHGAAELRTWPASGVALGVRRWHPGAPAADWRHRVWEGSRLEPRVTRERRSIVSDRVGPPDPSGAVDWIPPTPEEEVPTPARFVIHFAGCLGVEIRAPGADSLEHRPGLRERAGARLLRLAPANRDRYRIRLRMTPADAGALYRSLPEGIPFLADLPPG